MSRGKYRSSRLDRPDLSTNESGHSFSPDRIFWFKRSEIEDPMKVDEPEIGRPIKFTILCEIGRSLDSMLCSKIGRSLEFMPLSETGRSFELTFLSENGRSWLISSKVNLSMFWPSSFNERIIHLEEIGRSFKLTLLSEVGRSLISEWTDFVKSQHVSNRPISPKGPFTLNQNCPL